MTHYGLRRSEFDSQQEQSFLLIFRLTSGPVLGPTELSTQWVLDTPSLGIEWPQGEADHSPTFNTDVKYA
jgi:hypothetical protein